MSSTMPRRLLVSIALPALLVTVGCDGFYPVDHAAEAQQAYAAGKFSEARIHLANQLKESPGDAAASMMLAKTLLETGAGIEVKTILEKLSSDPQYGAEASALYVKAMAMNGENEKVLERTAQLEGPHVGILAWSRAVALAETGEEEAAKQVIEQGLALAPGHVDLLLLKGTALMGDGRQDEARAIAKQLTSQEPPHPLALIFAGNIARADGDEKQAQDYLNRALETRPEHPKLLGQLGDSYRATGDLEKAREFYGRSLELMPGNANALVNLAELELVDGNQDTAFKMVQDNGPLVKSVPEGLRLAGLIALERGNTEQARVQLNRYLIDAPEDPLALSAMAEIYDKLKQPEQAKEMRSKAGESEAKSTNDALGGAIRNASSQERSHIDLAEKAMGAKRWLEADKHYTALIGMENMRNPVVFNNAAMVKLQLGDKLAALSLAERAYGLAPNDPYVKDSLGWALFMNGKSPKRAASLLTQAYDAAPNNFEITWHLAQVLAQVDRKRDAAIIMNRLKTKATPAEQAKLDQLIAQL